MPTVLSRRAFADLGAPALVYVRAVRASDLQAEANSGLGRAADIHPDQILYAVHGADGVRLAVLAQRDEAFATAMAHELAPVSVH